MDRPQSDSPSPAFQHKADSEHGKGPSPYKFNAEETRALRECNSESFYYRSLPIGTALAIAGHYSVALGYLKPSPRYGSKVKIFAGGFLGYFLGKLSYQRQCEEKLMKLENSPLADALRRRKGITTDSGFVSPGSDTYTYQAAKSDVMTSSLDLDSDRNTQSQGLDDSQRPSMDSPERAQTTPEEPVSETHTSYQDLRQSNRDEYEIRRIQNLQRQQEKPAEEAQIRYQSRKPRQPTSGAQNKYGDVWEEDASP